MSGITRIFRGFYRLLLPTVIFLVLAFLASALWLVYTTAHPPQNTYLITPEKFALLSTRAAKITDENWTNMDGTQARGWLLKGKEGLPAVILLHKYGADRSWVLNLGVKLNETTDYTVLMVDLRGSGESPLTKSTTFGGSEGDDLISAIGYLKTLKSETNAPLVGKEIGVYGVELGAIAALEAATSENTIKALALDSIPKDSNDLLASVIDRRFPFASGITSKIAESGTYLYYLRGGYKRGSMCDFARKIKDVKTLMLATPVAPTLQSSTIEVTQCFPNQAQTERNFDLNPSGFNIGNATNEQSGVYDLRVIDFFRKSLFTTSE